MIESNITGSDSDYLDPNSTDLFIDYDELYDDKLYSNITNGFFFSNSSNEYPPSNVDSPLNVDSPFNVSIPDPSNRTRQKRDVTADERLSDVIEVALDSGVYESRVRRDVTRDEIYDLIRDKWLWNVTLAIMKTLRETLSKKMEKKYSGKVGT